MTYEELSTKLDAVRTLDLAITDTDDKINDDEYFKMCNDFDALCDEINNALVVSTEDTPYQDIVDMYGNMLVVSNACPEEIEESVKKKLKAQEQLITSLGFDLDEVIFDM